MVITLIVHTSHTPQVSDDRHRPPPLRLSRALRLLYRRLCCRQGAGESKKQAKGLTSDAPAAMKATARIQRVHRVKCRSKEAETQAAVRALVDLSALDSLCHYRSGLKVTLQGQSSCWMCIGQP